MVQPDRLLNTTQSFAHFFPSQWDGGKKWGEKNRTHGLRWKLLTKTEKGRGKMIIVMIITYICIYL